MRLKHTGVEIGNSGARRCQNGNGSLRFDGKTECEKRCDAFVNDDVQVNQLSIRKRGSYQRKRLRTCTG
jgi:hypothetical protein